MLEISNTVLVVVDFQGKLARIVDRSESVLRNAQILIQGIKLLDIPAVMTEQYPQGLGHTVEEITRHSAGVPVIEKTAFSCYSTEEFRNRLSSYRRRQVLLCGIEAHVCVYQTARDLLAHDYELYLVTDAVSSRTPENRQLGIHRVEKMGGILTSTEMALFELMKDTRIHVFKAISNLVK
ncbi:MAG: hydrolase [Chlorobi bacterium]|nr:hydrolase [Chlorobiota bacterium]